MEIKFNNVTYKENIRTPLEKTYLSNINITFTIGINVVLSSSSLTLEKIPYLINCIYKPTSGYIQIDNYINDGKFIRNINKLRSNISYIPSNIDELLLSKKVKQELSFGLTYFKYKLNKKNIRLEEALKLVGLDASYLNKEINSLSLNEKKKVCIASSLIFNPNIIIFNEPTRFLTNTEITSLIKLINLLKDKYHKTIIILTKNTDFVYKLNSKIYILDNEKLVTIGDNNLLNNIDLLNKVNLKPPEIVKFINTSNNLNANLTHTSNIRELIKEVYRNAK